MARKVKLLVGSKKGVFILESDERRRSWRLAGPFCESWPIRHAVGDPRDGAIYAAGGNEWFGPALWKSTDGGARWTHSSQGLAYAAGETPIKAAWSVASGHGRLYVGVEPAGLFVSDDGGASFSPVEGLRDHPTRPDWLPGGGGLILHSIVLDPDDAQRIWVAISAAGVFYSGDGGASWTPRNKGTRADFLPEGQRYPEFGQCVHCLVKAPGRGDRLYQQNHCGMYRSDDGGETWTSIEAGLPSSFGFPAAAHPRDPDALFLFPLNGAEQGRFAPDAKPTVWKTSDGGAHWRGPAAKRRLFRRAAAGDGDGPVAAGRRLFRRRQRRGLRQRRRGRELGADRRKPADDLVGRDAGDRSVTILCDDEWSALVRLPASLTALFPGAPRVVVAQGDTVAALIDALDARWPGMRDRLCDSTPAVRRHVNVFVNGARAKLDGAVPPGAEVTILTAISGG